MRQHTYGWLVVTVCFLALLVVVLGHVAQDRWCGPVLCAALETPTVGG